LANTTTHTDQYLITGLVENNSTIINEIYKKYSGKIYNWIKQHNGNQTIAEDIFQEAIIDIYRKATDKSFTLTCPFDAFLFVVVRNKWYSYLKNNKNQVVTDLDNCGYEIENSTMQSAEDIMQYEKQHILLIEKLNELHEGCKELLKLSWSGLCMEDVAEKLKVTYAYVRKKKSLCMAKLVESIKNSNQFHLISFKN
jgi:RNA polymerase sigma factor (sigma-70 family)